LLLFISVFLIKNVTSFFVSIQLVQIGIERPQKKIAKQGVFR